MRLFYRPVLFVKHFMRTFFVMVSLSAVLCLSVLVSPAIAQVNFTRQTHDPILSPGDHGSWDDGFIYQSTVIRKGSLYEMWYEGGPDHGPRHIGYARSPDGVNWIKDPNNPALSPGDSSAWDEGTVAPGTVIFDGTNYHMWYFGFDANDQVHGVGYASSTSGLSWTKHQNNPVLSTGDHDAFDHHAVHWPSVVHDGTTYHMWYGGETGNHDIPAAIGYATSPDGVVWTKHTNNPRLEAGHHDAWDGHWARQPAVVFDGTTFHMFYHGASGLSSAIGYARSSDGMNWKKFPGNPVMEAGPHGSWDDAGVTNAAVMLVGDTFKMWYTGVGGSVDHHGAQSRVSSTNRMMQKSTGQNQFVFQIGLATAPVATAEPVIEAIADVPHDQGNQVRVIWNGSLFDGLDDTETVIEYNLWRYVEERPHGKAATRQADEQVGLKMAAAKGDGRAVELNGILWDFVATIPVHRNARYAYVAPTLSNTTNTDTVSTVFMVSAHTADPSIYFDSVPAAGFSVDNLAPAAPTNLIAKEAEVGGISAVVLSWDESADSDFAFFALYRDDESDLWPKQPSYRIPIPRLSSDNRTVMS